MHVLSGGGRTALAVSILWLIFSLDHAAAGSLHPQEILQSIFLGQAYEPNVFCLLGVHDRDRETTWSKEVVIRCMESNVRVADRTASFQEEDSPESFFQPKPIGFFSTVLGSEIEDPDLGAYTGTDEIMACYPVVAFAPSIQLGMLDFVVAGKARPMTEEEEQSVNKQRAQHAQETKDADCTTMASFLDDAKQLWTSEIEGGVLSIRVSQYSDPGCLGHLSDIYVVDVLESGKLRASGEIRHYRGPI